jgi:hypothetical protein
MKALKPKINPAKWQKVEDEHKPPRRVRGLWRRYDTLYAMLNANDGKQYFYPLHGATTVPQAILKRQALKQLQQEGKLLPPSQIAAKEAEAAQKALQEIEAADETNLPAFTVSDAIVGYRHDRDLLGKKNEGTGNREDSGFRFWVNGYGDALFEYVTSGTLHDFSTWRMECAKEQGINLEGRGIDLDVLALQHVQEWAKLKELVPETMLNWKWKKLAGVPEKDELLTPEQMSELCNAALVDPDAVDLIDKRWANRRAAQIASGQQFYDYMRLLQHAGGRKKETTLQRWTNVTWRRIAACDGDGGDEIKKGEVVPGNLFFPGKYAKAGAGKPAEDRWVDFHQDLEDHLRAMYERRDTTTDWMFPSRLVDGSLSEDHVRRFDLYLNKAKARLRREYYDKHPDTKKSESFWFDRVSFQWFRHYFISHAVMAHIDYKTIAYWVSHRDGGVLIGKLYGHWDKTHGRQMSARLTSHLLSRR